MPATPADTLRIAARTENLPRAVDFVEQWAEHFGLAADKKFSANLSLEEAFINICHYAYPEKEGVVELTCCCEDGFFTIELIDAGVIFDILTIADPDLEASVMERKVGGLGVHFIRTLSDGVSYQRRNDHNVLRIQFRTGPPPAGQKAKDNNPSTRGE